MVRIELLGAAFSLESDESPEYLQELVRYLETRIHEVERTVRTNDSLKKAILAAILVTDELFQARRSIVAEPSEEESAYEIERITSRLLNLLAQDE